MVFEFKQSFWRETSAEKERVNCRRGKKLRRELLFFSQGGVEFSLLQA